MSYQPPLIGTKQLLNIKASSWPYWGSLFIALSMLTAGFALYRDYFTGAGKNGAGAETAASTKTGEVTA
jgi:hypothetical protein